MIEDMAVVMPAYNEGRMISTVLKSLVEHIRTIIVIDDGSTDNTYEQAKGMGVIVLRHLINVGQGGSLRTGFEYALKTKNEFIATIDADGQHRIDDLLKMYAFMKEHRNVDILLGSRFLEGGNAFNIPKPRKLLLKSATYVSRLLHGISITDIYNGLRIFRKQSLTSLKLKTYGTAHASEILHEISRQNFMYREFPVNIYYTDYSIKKGLTTLNSLRIIYEYFILRRI